MTSPAAQNPPAQAEPKVSSKKKKAVAGRTESPVPSVSPAPEKTISVTGQDGQDDSLESSHIRELQKSIRNVTKKITNASKTDSIIEQHKGKSLDELVEEKLINPDQRAQRLKKPQLEAQLAQLEEQLAQYKKVDEEYRTRIAAEKAGLEKSLADKFEKEKADAVNEAKEQAAADAKSTQHDNLLVLSQFLRLAAARRSEDVDATLDENMALEGVLLNVYSGDENAVSTMLKFIEGSDERTVSVSGDELQTTYAQVKAAAIAHVVTYAVPDAAAEPTEAPVEAVEANGADTVSADAGLPETDAAGAAPAQLTNGHTEIAAESGLPDNADVVDGAAGAVAEPQWDPTTDLSASQEGWVKVPRESAETEAAPAAAPAAAPTTVPATAPAPVPEAAPETNGNPQQSWADEQPDNPPQAVAATEVNDGFHQVQRNRPRGQDREGGWRGRGRGDYRGGYRGHGEGRGRGRGRGRGLGNRGGRPRNNDEP